MLYSVAEIYSSEIHCSPLFSTNISFNSQFSLSTKYFFIILLCSFSSSDINRKTHPPSSSKNNKLPDWDAYYKKFCDNQYILNETIQTNEESNLYGTFFAKSCISELTHLLLHFIFSMIISLDSSFFTSTFSLILFTALSKRLELVPSTVFAGMIADAWYAVKEYHLRQGPK